MSDLLLPSEIRRLAALKAAEGTKTPEKGEVPPEAPEPLPNPTYPFVTLDESKGKTSYELEDLNRVRKIMWFHDQPDKYQKIVKQFPEQKFYKDKFIYTTEDDTKAISKPKLPNTRRKGKGGTFYN